MAKHLVLVAGNIGAGKTSLTERLAARLNWSADYESVADNPYLSDFYGDMRAWSFHLQIFFLGHRAAQHRQLALDPRSAIIDRSIYEDAHIFARALHEMGNLSERDYTSYLRLYNLIVESLPAPALLIYLRAPVEVLVERITRRGRAMESGITRRLSAPARSVLRRMAGRVQSLPGADHPQRRSGLRASQEGFEHGGAAD